LHEYIEYYNTRRPHQGLEQDSPMGMLLASQQGSVRYREVLGGIIRDYYREAAWGASCQVARAHYCAPAP
jgi:hypothetical protein